MNCRMRSVPPCKARPARMRREGLAAVSVALPLVLSACGNIHPLYGTAGADSPSVAAVLASIAIPEPDTRLGQLIRNDLISTMRPAGTARSDRYTLEIV